MFLVLPFCLTTDNIFKFVHDEFIGQSFWTLKNDVLVCHVFQPVPISFWDAEQKLYFQLFNEVSAICFTCCQATTSLQNIPWDIENQNSVNFFNLERIIHFLDATKPTSVLFLVCEIKCSFTSFFWTPKESNTSWQTQKRDPLVPVYIVWKMLYSSIGQFGLCIAIWIETQEVARTFKMWTTSISSDSVFEFTM